MSEDASSSGEVPEQSEKDALAGIHDGNERFKQAVRESDAAATPSLYTKDGKILPPNGEPVSGSDSIAAFWQIAFESGVTEARPVTQEVISMGEYALEVGEYSLFAKDDLIDRGKIMVLWKNEAGVWRMHRDTWNSSIPLPEP
jgi:ketosteroid isomerase-like protein